MNIPKSTHGIVGRMADSIFPYQGWPTVAVDQNGQLFVAASGFRAGHVCPFGKIVLYKSTDLGNHWTPPMVVHDSPMDDRDAGILNMGDQGLLISWFNRSPLEYQTPHYQKLLDRVHPYLRNAIDSMTEELHTLTPKQAELGSYVRISPDGSTWSAPIRVSVMAPHGPNRCADGTLIYLGCAHHPLDNLADDAIGFYTSGDNGRTWERKWMMDPKKWASADEAFCEPHVIELPDGSLLGALRIDKQSTMTIATIRSKDGGRTWTDPQPTGLCGGPPHFMLHSSGKLLLSYGRRLEPFGQRVAVSYDNGSTWRDEYVLDNCPASKDLGYASTAELPDGSLITVYYQRLPNDDFNSILYTKWKLED